LPNYRLAVTARFKKEAKILSKKYRSLKQELTKLRSELEVQPELGIPIGHNCYKIRISISSKGKGKSGGGRVITCVKVTKTTVYLLSIYDKSEKENITTTQLLEWIEELD
jgi:mRNA-degrading endonuclease RelE of RelBE toxin-antitoxin system